MRMMKQKIANHKQIVRTFLVIVMEWDNFLNFPRLLKNYFIQKKISETGEFFLCKDLQWDRYIGILFYKF